MKRVWFPDGYTEAHRTLDRISDLLDELHTTAGIEWCIGHEFPGGKVDAVFCGSIFKAEHVRRTAPRDIPVIHYNWDLYPWVVENRKEMGWDDYLKDLETCAKVLVPGVGTQLRTRQMCDRDAVIVKPPVKVWDIPMKREVTGTVMYFRDPLPEPFTYVLDVMRDYPWDKGFKYPEEACNKLGLRLIRTKTETPWVKFKWLVANAGCLVSAVDEASTGGLTLLEGYAHGVPVVVSDSAWNEAGRYFVDRAWYFDKTCGSRDLVRVLSEVIASPRPTSAETAEQRAWVLANFSDAVFVRRVTEEVLKCLS